VTAAAAFPLSVDILRTQQHHHRRRHHLHKEVGRRLFGFRIERENN